MKKLTAKELLSLLSARQWQHQQDDEISECDVVKRQVENELIDVKHCFGWASITTSLDGIVITYTEGFNFDAFMPSTLAASTDGQDNPWEISGASLIDDDGDPLSFGDFISAHHRELPDELSAVNYAFLDMYLTETEDVDYDEDSSMDTFTLERDNDRDIRFKGELIATARSRESGGRWTELALYKTQGGTFICHQIGRTMWGRERDRFSAAICRSNEEIINFFGLRWLAKELYGEAGIDTAQQVD